MKIGIPLNEPDKDGSMVLDSLVFGDLIYKRSQQRALVPRIINLGASFSENMNWESDFTARFNLGQDLGICPIMTVELQRSTYEFADGKSSLIAIN